MPIVVHMHASISNRRPYGSREARIFLNELLAAAPDVPVQIAHLGGAGDYGDTTDVVLGVFADAIAQHDARMKHVWFDVTTVVRPGISDANARRIAERIRQLDVQRVLYGSDAAAPPNLAPREGWAAFHKLPLTDAEFQTIAHNITPYMRM